MLKMQVLSPEIRINPEVSQPWFTVQTMIVLEDSATKVLSDCAGVKLIQTIDVRISSENKWAVSSENLLLTSALNEYAN